MWHKFALPDTVLSSGRWASTVWAPLMHRYGGTLVSGRLHTSTLASLTWSHKSTRDSSVEATIPSRVTKGTLLNQMPEGEWNIDIKKMAVIPGDRQNRTILQKSKDRVSKSKESHQYAFVSSSQTAAVLLPVTSLPPTTGVLR